MDWSIKLICAVYLEAWKFEEFKIGLDREQYQAELRVIIGPI